jgi:DNA-binding transcriptional regulator YiaG
MDATKNETLAIRRVHRLAKLDRLRELREENGLSQSDVARYLDLNPSSVSRWEGALSRPNGRHALALLELLEGD